MKSIAWDIWLYCDYACKFCGTRTDIYPDNVRKTDEISDAWQKIFEKYGRCKIYITGGEPFLYPDIFAVIERMTKMHDIHITTNLSFDVEKISNVKADKKSLFINTTFHPCYASVYDFIAKFSVLKKYGYGCAVSYMSDDSQMAELPNYKKIFESYGITLTPTVYNGRRGIEDFAPAGLFGNETAAENSEESESYCSAGKDYACVDSSGDVFACSVKRRKLGNIFSGDFSFLNEKIKCGEKCVLSEKKYC